MTRLLLQALPPSSSWVWGRPQRQRERQPSCRQPQAPQLQVLAQPSSSWAWGRRQGVHRPSSQPLRVLLRRARAPPFSSWAWERRHRQERQPSCRQPRAPQLQVLVQPSSSWA